MTQCLLKGEIPLLYVGLIQIPRNPFGSKVQRRCCQQLLVPIARKRSLIESVDARTQEERGVSQPNQQEIVQADLVVENPIPAAQQGSSSSERTGFSETRQSQLLLPRIQGL